MTYLRRICPMALSCLVLLSPAIVHGELIPIVNAGFEDPVLAEDAFTFATLPGWTAAGLVGAYNPTSAQYPGGIPEGRNVGWINGGAFSQSLATVLQVGTYELRVDVGNRTDTPFPTYQIELLAGSVVLAQDLVGVAPPDGEFRTSLVRYKATAGDANLGQSLGIRFSSPGAQVNFDDVRLAFTAVPEPSSLTLAGVAMASGLVVVWRRRGRTGSVERY